VAGLCFAIGFVNAILNSFIAGIMQITVPPDKRGKVFGLSTSLAGGLTPIAFATGGLLAEIIPVRLLISGSFVVTLLIFIPLFLNQPFRRFINFDPDKHTLEDIV